MSRNIVFEGWLTKSPPEKRIWRTKWQRRWFALRQSGELPGQYFLDYYTDRNRRRLKGTINLDLCEQVDAGLHMERTGHSPLDPKIRGSVFSIQTQSRTYHLEADCESDMEKWVDAICRVCGLRATEEGPGGIGIYHHNNCPLEVVNDQHDCTGPYIPISECITGVRAQDSRRAFTFDPQNIVTSSRTSFDKPAVRHLYTSQPQIRLNNAEFSENESTMSDEECKSLNTSRSNIRDWAVEKSFTKLAISPKKNGSSEDGPPVPPRPPKTLPQREVMIHEEPKTREVQQEPAENQENVSAVPAIRIPRKSQGPPTAARPPLAPAIVTRPDDDDDIITQVNLSTQYCNLSSLPPAVDRALKPRHSSYTVGHNIHHFNGQTLSLGPQGDGKSENHLQYLDLDLTMPKSSAIKQQDSRTTRNVEVCGVHLNPSAKNSDSAYKTVDFLKTEAFNITRQDAEASRSNHF